MRAVLSRIAALSWAATLTAALASSVPAGQVPEMAARAGEMSGRAQGRLAVLPFAPRGAPSEAWPALRAAIEETLPVQGFRLVRSASVEAHLKANRLREMSILSHEEIAGLAEAVGADRVLLGYIYRWETGNRPAVSFSGRVLSPGRLEVERMAVTIVEGQDLLGPLGIGGPVTFEQTLREAASRFAAALSGRADPGDLEDGFGLLRRSALGSSPTLWISNRIGDAEIRRIAVMPFRNESKRPGAGQVAADIAAWCLMSRSIIALADAGDAARHLLQRGWRTGLPIGRDEVLALGGDPGVDAVMMGTVDRWEEGSPTGDWPPRISFSARLLDARTGGILWAADHERRGDETLKIYGAGYVRLAEALFARSSMEVLEPLVSRLGATKPSGGRYDPWRE